MKAAALRLWTRVYEWVLGLGSVVAVIGLLASMGGGAVLARQFGYWSYLGFIGADSLLVFAVLAIFLPPKHKKAWVSDRFRNYFAKKGEEIQRGRIARLMRVPFLFILVLTLGSPVAGGVGARLAGLTEQKAWAYCMSAMVLVNVLKVSVFLGIADPVTNAVLALYHQFIQ